MKTTNLKDTLSTIFGVLQLIGTGIFQAIDASKGQKINWAAIGISLGVGVISYLTGKNSDGSSKLPNQLTGKVTTIVTDIDSVSKQLEPLTPLIIQLMPQLKNPINMALQYANDPNVKNLIDTIIAANKPIAGAGGQATEVKSV
jgi:hypothetical protein